MKNLYSVIIRHEFQSIIRVRLDADFPLNYKFTVTPGPLGRPGSWRFTYCRESPGWRAVLLVSDRMYPRRPVYPGIEVNRKLIPWVAMERGHVLCSALCLYPDMFVDSLCKRQIPETSVVRSFPSVTSVRDALNINNPLEKYFKCVQGTNRVNKDWN